MDNLLGLLTVLIQIHFLKGNSLEIVVLVCEGNIELYNGLSSFELVSHLVSDSLECHQFSPKIP